MSVLLLDEESSDDECCIVNTHETHASVNDLSNANLTHKKATCEEPHKKAARVERVSCNFDTRNTQHYRNNKRSNNNNNSDYHRQCNDENECCQKSTDPYRHNTTEDLCHTIHTPPAILTKVLITEQEQHKQQEINQNEPTSRKLFVANANNGKPESRNCSNRNNSNNNNTLMHKKPNGNNNDQLLFQGEEEEALEENEEEKKSEEHNSEHVSASPINMEKKKVRLVGGDGLTKMDAFIFGSPLVNIQSNKINHANHKMNDKINRCCGNDNIYNDVNCNIDESNKEVPTRLSLPQPQPQKEIETELEIKSTSAKKRREGANSSHAKDSEVNIRPVALNNASTSKLLSNKCKSNSEFTNQNVKPYVVLLEDSIDEQSSNNDKNTNDSDCANNLEWTSNQTSVDNRSVYTYHKSPNSILESTISPLQQTLTQESESHSPAPSQPFASSPSSLSSPAVSKQMNLTDFFTRLSCSRK